MPGFEVSDLPETLEILDNDRLYIVKMGAAPGQRSQQIKGSSLKAIILATAGNPALVESVNGQTGPVLLDAEDVGAVATLVAGANIQIDATDPQNPIISLLGAEFPVNAVLAGTGIDVDSADPANPIVALTLAVQLSLSKADSAVQTVTASPGVVTVDATDPHNLVISSPTSTSQLPEGLNLYFTDSRAQAANAAALALKADLASPTFTGTPAAPTAAPGTNTTQLSTTAFVTAAIAALSTVYQGLSAILTSISALASNGFIVRTATGTVAARSLTAPAAGLSISNSDAVAGNPTFALANDLAALEGLGSTGIAVRTAADTWAQRSIAVPAEGLSITNPLGVAGNFTLALANDLAALEGLGSTGIAVRTAADTWAQRSVVGTANEITVNNGDAVAGNVTLSLPSALTFSGKTVTGGSYASPVVTGTFENQGAEVHSGDITPTTLAASADDYSPTGLATAARIRLAASTAVSLTGLLAGVDGRRIMLHNTAAFAITLKDEDAGSAAANRFTLNGDIALSQDQSIQVEYDGTTQRWRAVGGIGGGGGVSDGDKGDITVSGGGTSWSIDANAVTLAKIVQIATARFLGRITGGSGNTEELTGTQATTLLDVFTTSLKGLVPSPGGVSNTTDFLRRDQTWAAPPNPTLASLGGVPIATSNVFPVGATVFVMCTKGSTVAAGATTAGSDIRTQNFDLAVGGGSFSSNTSGGQAQTGTWRNDSGITMGGGGTVPRMGLWTRTA